MLFLCFISDYETSYTYYSNSRMALYTLSVAYVVKCIVLYVLIYIKFGHSNT